MNPGPLENDQFYVTSLPAEVGYPTNKSNSFGVFSVQLDSLPKTDGFIKAQCIKNKSVAATGKSYKRPDHVQRYSVGIPLRYEKAWTGSGSIISHLDPSYGPASTPLFGINLDYAMVLRDGTSHATFQWYSSSPNCSSLTISGKNGGKADVAIKRWDNSDFISLGSVSLPYKVNAIASNNYYIVSVKPESQYQPGVDYITAKCLSGF